MFDIFFKPRALSDINEISLSNPKIARKTFQILQDICEHPFEGLGKPETLKHNLSGYWSRRIDGEHRMIYKVEDKTAIIISCKGHYEAR